MEFPLNSKRYGQLGDRITAAAVALEKGVKIVGGKPMFKSKAIENLWRELESRKCVRVIRGKLPFTRVIPVGNLPGYLTDIEPEAEVKANASFFIMDNFDCATVYDHIGTVLGLCVKDGVVKNPPNYNREALLVKADGTVCVQQVDIRDMEIEMDGVRYLDGKNATIYTRPKHLTTPCGAGKYLVIVGNRVVAIKESGPVQIPASGYVLKVNKNSSAACVKPGCEVIYHGMEDVKFGIQVGNSIVRDGVRTDAFISRFSPTKTSQ